MNIQYLAWGIAGKSIIFGLPTMFFKQEEYLWIPCHRLPDGRQSEWIFRYFFLEKMTSCLSLSSTIILSPSLKLPFNTSEDKGFSIRR